MKRTQVNIKIWILISTIAIIGILKIDVKGDEARRLNDDILWGEEKEGVRLGILGSEKRTFSAREAIVFKIILENISEDTTKEVVQTLPESDYRVHVTDSKGNDVPLTRYGQLRTGPRNRNFRRLFLQIEPGGTRTKELHINGLYDMTLRGTYSVKVYRDVFTHDKDDYATIESKKITITVTNDRKDDEKYHH